MLLPLPSSNYASRFCNSDTGTVVHEYCSFVNVHVNSQLFFEQFHIHFVIHGGSRGQKVQSGSVRILHCTPSHLAGWVLCCGYCVFFTISSPWWPSHTPRTDCTLLYYGFIRKSNHTLLLSCSIFIFIGKIQTLEIHSSSQ